MANNVSEKGSGFESATNRATFCYPDREARALELQSKQQLAETLLDEIEGMEEQTLDRDGVGSRALDYYNNPR